MSGVGALDRAGAVWGGHAFDRPALETYCRGVLEGFVGPLEIAQFHGGASNPTFLLTDTATGARYVLRKKPPGALLASAHAVDREYRIMAALRDTPVPVPEMLAYCDDPGVIGTPFYLMPFLEGRIYKDNRFADMTRDQRAAAYDAIAATMAALHAIDPASVGLGDFGRPGNYFERQIARWSRQYRDAQTEDIASMERVMAALPTRIPADERAGIVHGDFRQENIMFAPAGPEVIALLDWELSTLGAPLADLGFFCLFYHADFMHWGSNATIDFAATGIPTEAEFVTAYCAASGRGQIDDFAFYLGFSAFRLASIAQGVHRRTLAGNARALHDGRNGARDWADLAERLLDDHR